MKRRTLLLGGTLALGAAALGWWVLDDGNRTVTGAGAVYSGRDDGVAIKGADAVAYFTQDRAVDGDPAHSHQWNGRTWHFASDEHRALFAADPERYAPRYGGYCAYAAAAGKKAKIEPEAWSIVDGRLYLNYDLGIRDRWDAKRAEYIQAADEKWPSISQD